MNGKNDADKFYTPLRIGKITEFKVMNAISEYFLQTNNQLRISNYVPQIDIDAVDLILRAETIEKVFFIQVQIKTGNKIPKNCLTEIENNKNKGSELWYVLCPKSASKLSDMLCIWGVADSEKGTLLDALQTINGAGEGT